MKLGARVGVLRTVFLTELGTALGIAVLSASPLTACLACLPLIGVALNGHRPRCCTAPCPNSCRAPPSSAGVWRVSTRGTIGGGAIAPLLYGFAGDAFGATRAVFVVAVAVCLLITAAGLGIAAVVCAALSSGMRCGSPHHCNPCSTSAGRIARLRAVACVCPALD